MWIKILLCMAIVAFCTALGYFFAEKYRARRRFFSQFCAFNERFLNELEFERKPVSAFLKSYEYTGDFGKAVKDFAEKRQKSGVRYLTTAEKALFEDYFSMLGRGDALSQKNYFGARKGTLAEKKTETEKEAKSRSDLYLKLGLLSGLAIVILII